ncbi:MAG: AAA family ATPase [Candidatus Lokiarchaeota archaeon]|nr:AAA family ATPase [Candidatus Lokiarchaeota archaeon]
MVASYLLRLSEGEYCELLESCRMKRVITLGGLHGTGKSSVADGVAELLGLRRVSAGQIFRQLAEERNMSLEEFSEFAEGNEEIDNLLDNTLRFESKKGNVILDGQLAAWMAGENADLHIFLTAPLEVRVRRIAKRDGTNFNYALEETITREKSEQFRYRSYYDIDVTDLSIYDLIINTEHYSLDEVISIVKLAVEILFETEE